MKNLNKFLILMFALILFSIYGPCASQAQEEEPEEESLNINIFETPKKILKARDHDDNTTEEFLGDCSLAIEIDNAMIINLEEEVKVKPLSYKADPFFLTGTYNDNDLRFDLCEPFHEGLLKESKEYKVIAKASQGDKKYKLAGRFTFPIISEDTEDAEDESLLERKQEKKKKN